MANIRPLFEDEAYAAIEVVETVEEVVLHGFEFNENGVSFGCGDIHREPPGVRSAAA